MRRHTKALAAGSTAKRRRSIGLAVLCASILVLAFTASPALATRSYVSRITGFSNPFGLAVDNSDNLWVTDTGSSLVSKYDSSGNLLHQSDGTDNGGSFAGSTNVQDLAYGNTAGLLYAADSNNDDIWALNPDSSYSGTDITSFPDAGSACCYLYVATDNSGHATDGDLYISDGYTVTRIDSAGNPVNFTGAAVPDAGTNTLTGAGVPGGFAYTEGVAVDSSGNLYVADLFKKVVDEFDSSGAYVGQLTETTPGNPFGFVSSVAIDPSNGDILVLDAGNGVIDEFDSSGNFKATIDGVDTPAGSLGSPQDLALDSHGSLYVSDADNGVVDRFTRYLILPAVSYGAVSIQGHAPGTIATLHATIDPNGGSSVTDCHFEYGTDNTYSLGSVPCLDSGNATVGTPGNPITGPGSTDVHADLSGLTSGTTYHYRVVATNADGAKQGSDQIYTPELPSVDSRFSSNLTATSADLNAAINPQGADTTYHFEYGTTTAYGASAPVPEADIGSSSTDQSVSAHLTGLTPHATYHFRVVATNPWGTTTSGDQTFDFFTPSCPNSQVRQQTGTGYLPECRAYELVSPAYAGGTALLYPAGPTSPLATNPSRFSFGGLFGTIPGAGDAQNFQGDLYVSTRTESGWVSRYVGIPASQGPGTVTDGPPLQAEFLLGPPVGVLTDPGMDTFMGWDNGARSAYDFGGNGSYAPFLWDSSGNSLGRLPTNLGAIPGAADFLDSGTGHDFYGATAPSPDFSHYFFSSGEYILNPNSQPTAEMSPAIAFAPGGLTSAPGSAYDDQIGNDTVRKISLTPLGADIPPETGDPAEFITFQGVSTNGSHVLMSPLDVGYYYGTYNPNRLDVPRHLYMRVGGGLGVTYDVSDGHQVNYVGMSADGSKVYFTTDQQLTPADHDTSTDLYMWSEAGSGNHLTLISLGNNGAGNSDSCSASWTAQCGVAGVEPYQNPDNGSDSIGNGGLGGNGSSDNTVAAANGAVYFYSPERLDGAKGTQDQQNLYLYRNGQVQYVTTFTGGPFCNVGPCSAGPVVRMQVSPDGAHMAFLTADQVTSYDNAGHLEMYTYDPGTGKVECVSCIPDGSPPTSNAEASDNGLFMTDDGRTFFSSGDALVPQDTDNLRDVYEYVDGRAQLISSGTSAKDTGREFLIVGNEFTIVGLSGVSADGTDAYFSTYDTLVGQDRNGNAMKFYDARAGGGFPFTPPPAPCAAADECHGAGSSAPPTPPNATGAGLGSGGNLQASAPHKRHHKPKRHKRHHARAAHAKRGGGK